jgi:hypothetical protein
MGLYRSNHGCEGAAKAPTGSTMSSLHHFVSGQRVRLSNPSRFSPTASGNYTITRLLPEERSGELQYRVKSDRESHERVVGENEIAAQTSEDVFTG